MNYLFIRINERTGKLQFSVHNVDDSDHTAFQFVPLSGGSVCMKKEEFEKVKITLLFEDKPAISGFCFIQPGLMVKSYIQEQIKQNEFAREMVCEFFQRRFLYDTERQGDENPIIQSSLHSKLYPENKRTD